MTQSPHCNEVFLHEIKEIAGQICLSLVIIYKDSLTLF